AVPVLPAISAPGRLRAERVAVPSCSFTTPLIPPLTSCRYVGFMGSGAAGTCVSLECEQMKLGTIDSRDVIRATTTASGSGVAETEPWPIPQLMVSPGYQG